MLSQGFRHTWKWRPTGTLQMSTGWIYQPPYLSSSKSHEAKETTTTDTLVKDIVTGHSLSHSTISMMICRKLIVTLGCLTNGVVISFHSLSNWQLISMLMTNSDILDGWKKTQNNFSESMQIAVDFTESFCTLMDCKLHFIILNFRFFNHGFSARLKIDNF